MTLFKHLFVFVAIASLASCDTKQPCTPAWYENVERKVGITDAQGHGPDIGSSEWRSAVEFKLGIRGDSAVPDRDTDEWCDYITNIIKDM